MPNSIRENDADVIAFVERHRADTSTVLDVGPGEGTYHRMLSHLVGRMDAVEIWEPNLADYELVERYDHVTLGDIRHYRYSKPYGLVIFGDVLEHLSVQDALAVFERARANARYVLVSVPIVHFPQGAIEGNHAETHLIEDPDTELIPLLGNPIAIHRYRITGTFIYRGEIPLMPRERHQLTVPLSSTDGELTSATLNVPKPMTQAEYRQMLRTLKAMEPAIVEIAPDPEIVPELSTTPQIHDGIITAGHLDPDQIRAHIGPDMHISSAERIASLADTSHTEASFTAPPVPLAGSTWSDRSSGIQVRVQSATEAYTAWERLDGQQQGQNPTAEFVQLMQPVEITIHD